MIIEHSKKMDLSGLEHFSEARKYGNSVFSFFVKLVMTQLKKVLELEFTVLEFFQEYVISMPREGVVLEKKQINDLVEACSGYYDDKDFIYISYRVNDYNVNPTIYLDLNKMKTLKGLR